MEYTLKYTNSVSSRNSVRNVNIVDALAIKTWSKKMEKGIEVHQNLR
jgi:hypothetical protein